MSPSSTGTTYVGRERELDQLTDALDAIEDHGSTVALVGDPGVGKSALISTLVSLANDQNVRVLTASGAEAESHLPFATLHQILQPILDLSDALPEGHRAALLGAIGIIDGPVASNLLFVALGALELIAEAGQKQPSLLVVDDLQWVDVASLDVLQFVARRLDAERVFMLLASRIDLNESVPNLDVERIHLAGLDERASRMLLEQSHPDLSHVDEATILELSAGNPLALLELPIALGLAEPGPRGWVSDDVPLTARLERAFAARVDQLDGPTATLALVAALQGSDSVRETLRAADKLLGANGTAAALEPLVSTGLLSSDGVRFEFRHPLVRSAIVQRATVSNRHAVHRALADVLVDDPDRATWHRSMATPVEDEEIASALEAGADRALARGGLLLAGEWLERAAYLSSDASAKAHRLLRAAEIAFELGRAGSVRRLTSEARALPLDETASARLLGIEAAFDDGVPGGADHIRRLSDAADRAHAGGEDGLAMQLLVGASKSAYWQAAGAAVVDPIRRIAGGLDVPDGDPRRIFASSLIDPFTNGAYVMEQLALHMQDAVLDPAAAGALSNAGFVVGDFSQALWFARRASEMLREQGRTALLAQTLVLETFASLYLGRWDITVVASAEAHRFAVETNQPVWAACALLGQGNVAGVRGDTDDAVAKSLQVEQLALLTGNRGLLNGAMLVRGHAGLGAQSPGDAFSALWRMSDPTDEAYQSPQCVWAVDHLADAAVQIGRTDKVTEVLSRFDELVGDTPAPGIRRVMALARAILADEADAEAHFRTASDLSVAAAPWYRGRVDLAYGSWLRRQRRVAESRDLLRSAQLVFDALGARGWSQRAEVELVAAGVRAKPSAPDAWARLSGQELQIAQLAAKGLSNRQIGERLYLSHRTVSTHLYRIFPKLGVTSRRQLHTALGDAASGEM